MCLSVFLRSINNYLNCYTCKKEFLQKKLSEFKSILTIPSFKTNLTLDLTYPYLQKELKQSHLFAAKESGVTLESDPDLT
jgi:hypothetical protein